MKKLLIPLFLVSCLTACATEQSGTAHDYATPQNLKIDDKSVSVTGDLLTPWKQNNWTGERQWQRHVIISFDNKPVIDGYLTNPRDVQGELTGEYNGKKITSVCTSTLIAQNKVNLNCMILVNNERTVTLTF